MNIKLCFMKLMVKRGRRMLLKHLEAFSIKGEKPMVSRSDVAPVMTLSVPSYLWRRELACCLQCPRWSLG